MNTFDQEDTGAPNSDRKLRVPKRQLVDMILASANSDNLNMQKEAIKKQLLDTQFVDNDDIEVIEEPPEVIQNNDEGNNIADLLVSDKPNPKFDPPQQQPQSVRNPIITRSFTKQPQQPLAQDPFNMGFQYQETCRPLQQQPQQQQLSQIQSMNGSDDEKESDCKQNVNEAKPEGHETKPNETKPNETKLNEARQQQQKQVIQQDSQRNGGGVIVMNSQFMAQQLDELKTMPKYQCALINMYFDENYDSINLLNFLELSTDQKMKLIREVMPNLESDTQYSIELQRRYFEVIYKQQEETQVKMILQVKHLIFKLLSWLNKKMGNLISIDLVEYSKFLDRALKKKTKTICRLYCKYMISEKQEQTIQYINQENRKQHVTSFNVKTSPEKELLKVVIISLLVFIFFDNIEKVEERENILTVKSQVNKDQGNLENDHSDQKSIETKYRNL